MKYRRFIILAMVLGAVFIVGAAMAEQSPEVIAKLAHTTIADLGTDPIIVAAVRAENAKGKTLDQIKAMDEKWKSTPGIADYMKAIMTSECGRHLRAIMDSMPFCAEIFVMDNQGANVAMADKTSDYWQGDEAKFKESFNGGIGAVFIDKIEFDDSSQAYLCQVSVPVRDEDQVIGAITVGVDIDKIESSKISE